jgi:hypothetical protein
VRDAACLACGRGVVAFPEESREVLEELYTLWFAHLEDNIYSVREDSAVALGNAGRWQAGMGGRMWIVDPFHRAIRLIAAFIAPGTSGLFPSPFGLFLESPTLHPSCSARIW